MRAAVSALSVAAYLEVNAARMAKAAPDLVRVLVGLLPHPDAEVQAHTATALANLAHGCPAFQSEAGEAGAINALLDVCRGRARARARAGGDNYCLEGAEKVVNPDTCSVGGEDYEGNAEEELRVGVDSGGMLPVMKPQLGSGSKELEIISEGTLLVVSKKPQMGKEEEEGTTREQWATKRRQGVERAATATTISTDTSAVGSVTGLHENEEGQCEDEDVGTGVGIGVGEKKRVADTMDVDAVQAATAALANLLSYSDANSMRLVAAGGIGVLVGLMSSYRPHNLLDFDQVCATIKGQARRLKSSACHSGNHIINKTSQTTNNRTTHIYIVE